MVQRQKRNPLRIAELGAKAHRVEAKRPDEHPLVAGGQSEEKITGRR
jgi:hypothetical protein